jgi:glycosyltransferase involved in cell wall biosynthesis
MENPSDCLVSIIVPVYNGAAFIMDTLMSVKQQTHHRFECIIVDDGSTDDTALVVKGWIASDSRFSYLYQTNSGLSGARNTGLDYSKGDFIQFLDADDVILPLKIEKQVYAIRRLPASGQPAVSYTDYATGLSADIFQPSDYYRSAQFHSDDYFVELITRWESSLIIPPHCFLFSADYFRKDKIRFDTGLPNHEDFDCWLNVFKLQPPVVYLDEKLCIYRITDGSMSKKMRLMGEGFLQVLDKHIHLPGQAAAFKKLFCKKRREVLRRYNRFDRMSFKDKLFSIRYISAYYRKRILQKAGLLPR